MSVRDLVVGTAGAWVVAAVVVAGQAAAPRVNVDRDGLTLKGYDVVAYFTDGKPVQGSPAFTTSWRGATWRFASAANRDTFVAAPEKYAPQFGGFCAWAVSRNYTADVDPAAWRIVDGRLVLNYSLSIRAQFEKDTAGNLAKADANWPGLSRTTK